MNISQPLVARKEKNYKRYKKMNYPAASGRGINKENIFNIAASGGE
jgi:hypothetical protein